MSSWPKVSSTAANIRSISSGLPVLAVSASARRPCASMAAVVSPSQSSERSQNATSAPALASPMAMACPMPLAPPVTRATRPSRRNNDAGSIATGSTLLVRCCGIGRLLIELTFQAAADPFVGAAQMLAQHQRRMIRIRTGNAVEQVLVRGHEHLAKIDIGNVSVEQEYVNLRTHVGPGVFQPAVIGGLVDSIVEVEIEFGGFLFRYAVRDCVSHLLDQGAHACDCFWI